MFAIKYFLISLDYISLSHFGDGVLLSYLCSSVVFFSKDKTLSISYKILQLRMLYMNPRMDSIVQCYVKAHWIKKGRVKSLLDEG